jgi:hypothetical protein
VDKRGYLMAQVEGKRWKKRWFVLRGFVLYYYNKKEEQDDIAGAEGEVSLENAVVTAHDEEESKPVRVHVFCYLLYYYYYLLLTRGKRTIIRRRTPREALV